MNILVTGAKGFVGSNLTANLRNIRDGKNRTRPGLEIDGIFEYDTDTAEFIQKKVVGAFGDPDGYEECLFKTPDGKFFLYGNGGENSPYAEEAIKRMSAAKAEEWKAE